MRLYRSCQAAARCKFAAHHAANRACRGHDVAQNAVHRVLIKNPQIPVRQQIKFQRLQFQALPARFVFNRNGPIVRHPRLRANRSVLGKPGRDRITRKLVRPGIQLGKRRANPRCGMLICIGVHHVLAIILPHHGSEPALAALPVAAPRSLLHEAPYILTTRASICGPARLRSKSPRAMLSPQLHPAQLLPKSSLRGGTLLCPSCLHGHCHRSRRRSVRDFAASLAGLWPWRCAHCQHRFFAGRVALRFLFSAHCGRCGNLDLHRLPRDQVQVWNSWIFKLARIPAYRCAPCRQRFFSILPRRKFQPVTSPADSRSTPASRG